MRGSAGGGREHELTRAALRDGREVCPTGGDAGTGIPCHHAGRLITLPPRPDELPRGGIVPGVCGVCLVKEIP